MNSNKRGRGGAHQGKLQVRPEAACIAREVAPCEMRVDAVSRDTCIHSQSGARRKSVSDSNRVRMHYEWGRTEDGGVDSFELG